MLKSASEKTTLTGSFVSKASQRKPTRASGAMATERVIDPDRPVPFIFQRRINRAELVNTVSCRSAGGSIYPNLGELLTVKIAALIMAHHRPDLLDALLDRLSSPLWARYVHIDKNSDIARFAGAEKQASMTPGRIAVHWGHVSQTHATLALLRQALSDREVTHFALMSGQCWPILADEAIFARLRTCAQGGNFIDLTDFPNSAHRITRLSRRHFYDAPNQHLRRLKGQLFGFLPNPAAVRLIAEGNLRSGSNWWLLSRRAAARIMAFVDAQPSYLAAFRHAKCGDEIFFNSAFHRLGLQADAPGPTFANFAPGNPNAATLTEAMWHQAPRDSHFIFARKIDGFRPSAGG